MKIADVKSILAGGAHFVEISTEDGRIGLGQSGCWAYPEATHAVVLSFRKYLLGQDANRIEHHWQHLYRMGPFRGAILAGALSAVDIALWDLKGQRLQAPIWDLIGGRCRDRLRLHLLIRGDLEPQAIAAQALEAANDGFTAIKFAPIPHGFADMTLEGLIRAVVARVAAARETVGSGVDIMLELHRRLTPLQAIPLIEAVRQFNPLFVEDPIQIDSIASQAEIARRVSTAIANGERLHTIWEFRELLAYGGSQYLRPDLGLAGGVTHCKKIAALGEAYHAAIVTHNFLGPVLTAASAHLDVAIPNFLVQEYSMLDEGPAAAAFSSSVKRVGGYLLAPEAPGLGVTLNPNMHERLSPFSTPLHEIPLRRDGSVAFAV